METSPQGVVQLLGESEEHDLLFMDEFPGDDDPGGRFGGKESQKNHPEDDEQ